MCEPLKSWFWSLHLTLTVRKFNWTILLAEICLLSKGIVAFQAEIFRLEIQRAKKGFHPEFSTHMLRIRYCSKSIHLLVPMKNVLFHADIMRLNNCVKTVRWESKVSVTLSVNAVLYSKENTNYQCVKRNNLSLILSRFRKHRPHMTEFDIISN